MRFLVTGATGFVGEAVVRRLLGQEDAVVAYVRDAARAAALAEAGAEVREGSIGDPNALAAEAEGCDVIVHAAAVRSHRASRRALEWVNIAGTDNVLAAARRAGCGRVVLVSCADVTLGNVDRVNWNEERDLTHAPIDAHARSKRLAEEVALGSSGAGLDVVALRPAWLWGAGDTSVLPELCAEGLGGGIALVGTGENLISTTHVQTFVDAVLSAAEVTAAVGRAYYITDNELLEAREFFGALSEAALLPPPRKGPPYALAYGAAFLRERLGGAGWLPTDVIHRGRPTHFDVARAVTDLDWEPRVTLGDGMAELGRWVAAQGGAKALAGRRRPPADDASVDAIVALAQGARGGPSRAGVET